MNKNNTTKSSSSTISSTISPSISPSISPLSWIPSFPIPFIILISAPLPSWTSWSRMTCWRLSLFLLLFLPFLFLQRTYLLQLLFCQSRCPSALAESPWSPIQYSSSFFVVNEDSLIVNFPTVRLLVCSYEIFLTVKLHKSVSSWFPFLVSDDTHVFNKTILFEFEFQLFFSGLVAQPSNQESLFRIRSWYFIVFKRIPLLNFGPDTVIIELFFLVLDSGLPFIFGFNFFLFNQFKVRNLKHFHEVNFHRKNRIQRTAFGFDWGFEETDLICLEKLQHITGHFSLHFVELPILSWRVHIKSILSETSSNTIIAHSCPKTVLEHVRLVHFLMDLRE